MFRALYDAWWQFPVGIFALQLVAAGALIRSRQRAVALPAGGARLLWFGVVIMQIIIMLDDASKGPWLSGSLATGFNVAFVIAGDLRFLLLLERFGREPRHFRLQHAALAIGVSAMLPLAAWIIATKAIGAGEGRVLFLVHEAMFAMLALGLWLATRARRDLAEEPRRWLTKLCAFELMQYALWAVADIAILIGADAGYLLRVVPNVMYYVAFVPFAWLTAPTQGAG
jgi:hypothetical protein